MLSEQDKRLYTELCEIWDKYPALKQEYIEAVRADNSYGNMDDFIFNEYRREIHDRMTDIFVRFYGEDYNFDLSPFYYEYFGLFWDSDVFELFVNSDE